MADLSTNVADVLKAQWQNPGDIFSLLLLVGGDIIQKAIARLAGVRIKLSAKGPHIRLSPVAFSFGWVAYGFITLASILGHQRLMPEAETSIKVINCESGYDRDNKSWILSRLFQDREDERIREYDLTQDKPEGSTGAVSLLIEIFVAKSSDGPSPRWWWWAFWLIILGQHALGIAAWVVYDQWADFLITICGTVLAIATASLPKWVEEKWPSKRLEEGKKKPVALTKGNGHRYVMLILSHHGSWDLEAMASSRSIANSGTRWLLGLFAMLWILLLVTVTGIKANTWFLIGVGGLGMMQNIMAAALPSSADDLDVNIQPWEICPTIVGYQYDRALKKELRKGAWKAYTGYNHAKPAEMSDAQREYDTKKGSREVRDVMGALIELEKYYPQAGVSLLPTFFPSNADYNPGFKIPREEKFWQYAEIMAS